MTTDEMFEAIDKRREAMRPFDVAEKIDRVMYVPGRIGGSVPGNWLGDHNARLFLGRGERDATLDEAIGADGDWADVELLKNAWRQLCDRVKPAPYFRQNIEALPPQLRFDAVNYMIHQRAQSEKLGDRFNLWRLAAPDWENHLCARGFVTNKYTTLDDNEILGFLRSTPELENARVRRFEVDEKDSLFAFEWPGRTFDLNGRDPATVSAIIRNSEVGTASVQIWGGIQRFFCTNQLHDSNSVIRITHVGDRRTRLKMVQDGIREAIGKADDLVDGLRTSVTRRLEDADKAIEDIGNEVGYGPEFIAKIREKWLFGESAGRPRVFDVVNAMTCAAQDLPVFVDRHDHERMAGDALHRLNKMSIAA